MTENKHLAILFIVLQAVLATMILTSLISVMHAFMGGSRSNPDFLQLYGFQVFGIGLSVAAMIYSLLFFSRNGALATGLSVAWKHMPGWLLFPVFLLNMLAICGELSYLLLRDATELMTEWINHVALICLGASSVAFLFMFAVSHAYAGGAPYSKERWSA
ncbi:MAG: hypothetical protein QNJ19_06100 [Woeseiaceae bacterium]|nr:hypothetical protein [Woeseiaceae bacterium]